MPRLKSASNSSGSHRQIYPLAEAASIAGCTEDQLLQLGESKLIELMARVPDDVSIYSAPCEALAEFEDRAKMWHSQPIRDCKLSKNSEINMLVLSPDDCGGILRHGLGQGVFSSGWAIRSQKPPQRILPTRVLVGAIRNSGLDWYPKWVLVTCKCPSKPQVERDLSNAKVLNSRTTIPLKRDTLNISAENLQSAVTTLQRQQQELDTEIIDLEQADKFIKHNNTSELLSVINRVAIKVWASTSAADETYPAAKDVVVKIYAVLNQNHKYLASSIEKIIRPDYAKQDLSPAQRKVGRQSFRSTLWQALVKASVDSWDGVNINDPKEVPTQTDVVADLVAYGFPNTPIAEHGAIIIRPDGAAKAVGKRKK